MTQANDPEPTPTAARSGASPVVGVLATLGLVAAATVAAIALGSGTPAGAVGLVRFESCDAIEAWADDVADAAVAVARDGDDALEGPRVDASLGGDAAPTAVEESGSNASGEGSGDADTGGTNTVVEGVDEVDAIDRIGDDRLLVASNGILSLVDLSGRQRLSSLGGLPGDARITHDGGVVFAAGSAPDGTGVQVQRIRLQGDSLVSDGSWSTSGWLLDARRTGGRLHVVAVDQPYGGGVPFPQQPVACDQVWRPVAPATTPAATLVASFAADGALEPVAAAEVAGTAGNILVTGDALYVATESWTGDGSVSTGLHRFDLAGLALSGSGEVPGTVSGPFAMNEHGGHLRVATHLGGGGGVGGPFPVEGDVIIDDFGSVDASVEPAIELVAARAPVQERDDDTTTTTEPDTTTTEPDTTTTTEPDVTTTTEPDTSTTSEPEPTTTSSTTSTSTTLPVPDAPPDALAEVFVLDLEGSLDVVGRTGRFGHDYETIHGVRFLGDVAYVITFRQTDPFYVIDLVEPAAPRVVGELQIPGFSAYLHPAGVGRVVGFGPDGNGSVSARLFDVSDPTRPSVLDEIVLGDDSSIVWDHHAYVDLDGGRFAVPVTDYPDTYIEDPDCQIVPGGPGVEPSGTTGSSGGDPDGIAEDEAARDDAIEQGCDYLPVGGGSGAAVLTIQGGRLTLVDRALVAGVDLFAERVVPGPDGTWWVLGYGRLVGTDGVELPVGA